MKMLKRFIILIFLPFLILIFGYSIYKLFLIPSPMVEGVDAFAKLPAKKEITLKTRHIKELSIEAIQDSRKIPIFHKEYEISPEEITITIEPKKFGLHDGKAVVLFKMASGILKKKQTSIEATVDTVAPKLQVLYAPMVLRTGESGLVVLDTTDADKVFIRLNNRNYKVFPFSKGRYVGLIPAGITVKPGQVFYAVAEDEAGNTTVSAIRTKLKKRGFKNTNIIITKKLIKEVVLPLLGKTETTDPLKDFKKINEEWRKRDEDKLKEIGQNSSEVFYIKGKFLQLKNSKVMAVYGEHRRYLYEGRPVSESYHLGYDLASVARAPVEAANRGKVVFAGLLGIYGNTVIIDHGLGLMSLYGHLSEIYVKKGQMVKKGQIIGRTGHTGFAAGDHLHFSILVQGEEVSPLYWWDAKWIKVHITKPLNEVF